MPDIVPLPLIEDPVPDEPELIAGLVPVSGQLLIAGETETGKSLTAIEICHALLTGQPLWQIPGQAETGLPVIRPVDRVLYLLGEHYPATIRNSWRRMVLETPPGRFNLVGPDMMPDRALVRNGQVQRRVVDAFKRWAYGRQMLVFDPLSSFVSGVGVENDNVVMRLALETMGEIAQSAGASNLVTAHAGKPTLHKGKEVSRTRYLLRGASATEDAATNVFYLLKDEVMDVASGYERLRLVKRKYKGMAPDVYELARDPATGRQRLYLGHKEFQAGLREERRQATEGAIAWLQTQHGLDRTAAVRAIAAVQGVGERTVWDHLSDKLARKAA